MKKPVRLSVNGREVSAEAEPRVSLADFLRDELLLTGTHLGCEHGVCGACTVEIDGATARSCITYAVACDGARVRTIEGYEGDAVMAELREAFSARHALQCGYCTPGMLVTARDIVLRLPDASEARIREALAGNLCRCTGYDGIVRAIQGVLAARKASGIPAVDPFPAAEAARAVAAVAGAPAPVAAAKAAPAPVAGTIAGVSGVKPAQRVKPQATLKETFSVEHPRDRVWAFFGRLDEVTACLPGASVSGTPTDDHADINLRVKVGPIVAEFAGSVEVARDAPNYSGLISGAARDARSNAATHGEIRYVLREEKSGAATRVDLDVGFTLTGALAQFGRSGLVQDVAKRMTAAFARNLEVRLSERGGEASADRPASAPAAELDAGSLVFAAVWNRIKAFFRYWSGRS